MNEEDSIQHIIIKSTSKLQNLSQLTQPTNGSQIHNSTSLTYYTQDKHYDEEHNYIDLFQDEGQHHQNLSQPYKMSTINISLAFIVTLTITQIITHQIN